MSSDEEEEEPVPLLCAHLPKRSTRGKRLNEIVDEEEEEADNEFWGQDAWKELSEDESIESDEYDSNAMADSEDSDIDQDEDEEEEDQEENLRQTMKRSRAQRARTGVYVDPALKKKPKRSAASATVAKTRVQPKLEARSLRTSTKSKTHAAESLRKQEERMRKKRQRLKSARKQANPPPAQVHLTQQQLLEEAAQTEIENRRSLQAMLMLQAESKHQVVSHKQSTGPRIRMVSRQGQPTILTFTDFDAIPAVINSKASPYPTKHLCAVTGLPAKYIDPKSGVPYATLEAFQAIRQGLHNSNRGKGTAAANDGAVAADDGATTGRDVNTTPKAAAVGGASF